MSDELAKEGSGKEQPPSHLSYREIKTLTHNKEKATFQSQTEGYNPNQDELNKVPRHQQTTILRLRTGHCRLNSRLKRIGVKTSAQCPCGEALKRTKHQNFTCKPADSTSKQASRCGPLVCPSKLSSGDLQKMFLSRHPMCGTHERDLVDATITSNAEEE